MSEWVLFPKPDEQDRLLNQEVVELFDDLISSSDGTCWLVPAAAYDLFFAANDRNKAQALLQMAHRQFGVELVTMIEEIIWFRLHHDGAEYGQQLLFADFCCETLGITVSLNRSPEVTIRRM